MVTKIFLFFSIPFSPFQKFYKEYIVLLKSLKINTKKTKSEDYIKVGGKGKKSHLFLDVHPGVLARLSHLPHHAPVPWEYQLLMKMGDCRVHCQSKIKSKMLVLEVCGKIVHHP
jgi:hypothetical protein